MILNKMSRTRAIAFALLALLGSAGLLASASLLASAGLLSAQASRPVSPGDQKRSSQSVTGAQGDAQALLHRKLCELNENWVTRTPHPEILADTGIIDDDVSLIQTHLKLVINELRSADVGHLSDLQLSQRLAHIEALQAYMVEGNFPRNVLAAGRRPVFIDPWGTHCAVGHLIATSGHASLANAINREHQLDFLRDIKTEGLKEWQQASGLSIDELALIQPTYRSTTLNYPKEIEDLILGNSDTLTAAIESGEIGVAARCGGKTLLHFAAAAGDLSLVKLLIQKGADLHAVSMLGCDKAELAKGGSQTVVTLRWNESTSVTGKGGMGMGRYGAVFATPRGQFIADVLSDLRGGFAGLNALDYATQAPQPFGFYRRAYGALAGPRYGIRGRREEVAPESEMIETLKKNRAAVAAWLEAQGLKAE